MLNFAPPPIACNANGSSRVLPCTLARNMASLSSPDPERGYTLVHTFDHIPAHKVWRLWTESELLSWFGGGPPISLENTVVDARPGGKWATTMLLPGGGTKPWVGRFREVEPHTRLVLDFADTDEDVEAQRFETYTVTLEEKDGSTHMVLRQSGGHLTEEMYTHAAAGTARFISAMDALVKTR